jgi:hypothetical protein
MSAFTVKKDFDFMTTLTTEFFNEKRVLEAISCFNENSIFGWEKWIQYEFYFFLNKHSEIKDVQTEDIYNLDGRKKTEKTMQADISFVRKGSHLDMPFVVELKLRPTLNIVKPMLKDASKNLGIKTSDNIIRSLWLLGLYPTSEHSQDQIDSIINKKANTQKTKELQNASNQLNSTYFSGTIGNSGYSFLLFNVNI